MGSCTIVPTVVTKWPFHFIIQLYKYTYTTANTQIQIHKHTYTNAHGCSTVPTTVTKWPLHLIAMDGNLHCNTANNKAEELFFLVHTYKARLWEWSLTWWKSCKTCLGFKITQITHKERLS